MKTERTHAIVLRRTNYGETDRILQLLTTHGRRAVIAKGVRKEKSRLAGGIELFSVCDVVLSQGKGTLSLLTSARLVKYYSHILDDFGRMEFGYEAMKYVGAASEQIDEPDWYNVLSEVLMSLDAPSIDLRLIKTWFYYNTAPCLGRQLNLERDSNGARLQSNDRYSYDSNESGLQLSLRGELTGSHITLLRLLQAKPLHVLVQIGGTEAVLGECLATARAHAALN